MSALAQPAVLAWLLSLAALALLPALHAERWLPGRDLVLIAVVLLALVGLLARALAARGRERTAAWLVAAGAALVLAGVGLDGLCGRQGTVTLGLGQTVGNFDETGPDGRSLGLRPLGFRIGAEAETAAGVSLLLPQGTAVLTGRRAIAEEGFRLADPRVTATGGVARLRVAASDGTRTDVAELTPDGAAQTGDLVLSLEQYFPDFALDEKQQPFTRSLEPRNPAALLSVARGNQVRRVFVLQSMPGVHRVEPLGLSFSLLSVEPERVVTFGVHRQPFALVVLLGGLLLIVGVAAGARSLAGSPSEASGDGPLVAGAGLLGCLLLVDSGRVLTWNLGLAGPGGRVPLPGVGILLGLALIGALAGVLLLASQRLAAQRQAGGVDVAAIARGALGVAVLAAITGAGLALVHVLSGGVGFAPALPVAGVALAALVLAAALRPPLGNRTPLVPIVSGLLLAVTLGVGGWSTATHGSYATPATAAASAAVFLGLAAREATGFAGLRRLALLLAVLTLLVRPF
jgi:hypothetical protein